MTRSWLRTPRLLMGEGTEEERHATWFELFFDLVYVVAIAELSHLLHEDLTPAGLLGFSFLFLPVWWVWTWFAYYADQFDTDDLPYRFVTVAAMFGTIVLALTLHHAFDGSSASVAIAYVVLRSLLIGLYVRARQHVPEARELCTRFITGFSIGAALWLVSIWIPEPLRFVLWGIGMAVELVTPPLSYITVKQVPAQISHMPERFGLFVIIVLGESIVAVARGIGDVSWQWLGVLMAIAGLTTIVCLWCLYFEQADPSVITRSVRSDKRGLLISHVWGYSYYLMSAGIGAISVGILAALETSDSGTLSLGGQLAFCGGVAAFLLGVAANHWASPQSLSQPILLVRLLVAAFLAVLGFGNGWLQSSALVGLVAVTLVSLVIFETITGAEPLQKPH